MATSSNTLGVGLLAAGQSKCTHRRPGRKKAAGRSPQPAWGALRKRVGRYLARGMTGCVVRRLESIMVRWGSMSAYMALLPTSHLASAARPSGDHVDPFARRPLPAVTSLQAGLAAVRAAKKRASCLPSPPPTSRPPAARRAGEALGPPATLRAGPRLLARFLKGWSRGKVPPSTAAWMIWRPRCRGGEQCWALSHRQHLMPERQPAHRGLVAAYRGCLSEWLQHINSD